MCSLHHLETFRCYTAISIIASETNKQSWAVRHRNNTIPLQAGTLLTLKQTPKRTISHTQTHLPPSFHPQIFPQLAPSTGVEREAQT